MVQAAGLFQKHKIDKIAIIDDYFDPPRREEDNEKIEGFWDTIKVDTNALDELRKLGAEIKDMDDISNDVLKKMWEAYAELNFLKGPFDKYIATLKKEESELDQFCNHLCSYGIEVNCFGIDDPIPDVNYKLIFIDYYLGPVNTGTTKETAVRKSIAIAKAINDKTKQTPDKSIFILISSLDVNQEMRNKFRSNADIMGGMFYFIQKKDISDKRKLFLLLYPIVRALESSYAIDQFIKSFIDNIKSVNDEFLIQINKLSISDYSYIQKLSLQKEGHPFGDYILRLFGEHFIRLLHDKMKEDETKINMLSVEDLPPKQFVPSLELTDIYQSSLFEFVSNGASLHLGSILTKDLDAYMVINAECDLIDTSITMGRKIEPDFALLLIQGKLVKHTEKDPAGTKLEVRTEFFERITDGNKEMFRISWYLNRVRAIRYGDIALIKKEGYKQICRLKLPYALQIQNAFASNLTRVGVPVAPPIYGALKVELFCEGAREKTFRLLELREDAAHLFFIKKSKDQCILSYDFIYDLLGKIEEAISKLKELTDEYEEKAGQEIKLKELKKKNQILKKLKEHDREQLKLLDPITLPKVDDKDDCHSIYITRGKKDIEGKQYPSEKCPLWLNFIDT